MTQTLAPPMTRPAPDRLGRLMARGAVISLLSAVPAAAREPLLIVIPPDEYRTFVGIEGLEGDVSITLDIDPKGDFRCLPSPGVQLAPLQQTSCRLIAQRDVFFPDFGKDGKAMTTRLPLVVRWRRDSRVGEFGGAIPISPQLWVKNSDYPLHEMLGGTTRAAFDVTEFGRVRNCRVVSTSGSLVLDGALCPLLERRAAFLPALTAAGQPRRTTAEFAHRWPFDDWPSTASRLPQKGAGR